MGYLLVDLVDDQAHIEQVSVDPRAGRRGVGRRLVEHAAAWATGQGFSSLTLCTFRDVPWNAPYYRRLGFVELPPRSWGPGLTAVRETERLAGLDRWPHVAMVRRL